MQRRKGRVFVTWLDGKARWMRRRQEDPYAKEGALLSNTQWRSGELKLKTYLPDLRKAQVEGGA